jgi:hypothetical protein
MYPLTPDATTRIAADRRDDALSAAAAHRAIHPPDRGAGRRRFRLTTIRDRLTPRASGDLAGAVPRLRRA